MQPEIEIGGRPIGAGHPTYVIAEMSANHGQDFSRALKIVEAAKKAGADAVKLQTYTPDTMTLDCDKPPFRIQGTLWDGRNLHELYQEAYTPWDWHGPLKETAESLGMDLFSTPFDASAVNFLEELEVPVHKIASFENVDIPLLRRVGATGKPVIVSTGMAHLGEIDEAVRTLREARGLQIALLKCTSAYPAPPESMNLRTISNLSETFGVPAGLSDHTLGIVAPVVAVTLGACIVEKHLTLSRDVPGPDSDFSLEPREFGEMVRGIRQAEKARGKVHYGPAGSEASSRALRRSLFVVQSVREGERFDVENVRSIRPGHGLHTRHLEEVLGRRATCDIERGTPLNWDHVGGV